MANRVFLFVSSAGYEPAFQASSLAVTAVAMGDETYLVFAFDALKQLAIGEAASIVSAIAEVRTALLDFQRNFAATPPGAVLDGRDIGTVIAPDADVKIFVVASPKARAYRRFLELKERGDSVNETEILADILKRDERDRSRTAAPLVRASDAHLLDTTHLDIDAAVRAAIAIVEAVRAG